jgi:hypothetical protein
LALAAAREEQARLTVTLGAKDSDEALYQRWMEGNWNHPGLQFWLSTDPDITLATNRVQTALPQDHEVYLHRAAFWLRQRIAEAQTQLSDATNATIQEYRLLMEQQKESPELSGLRRVYVAPYRRSAIVWVQDPYRGHFSLWWHHSTRSALSDGFLYRWSGTSHCYDRKHRPHGLIDF